MNDLEQKKKTIGRLAPSPTGPQHVGNARTYLLAWLSVRLQGGQLIMRMEDLDSSRVRNEAIDQAICDLHWLGLDWDYGPGGNCFRDAEFLLPSNAEDLVARNPEGLGAWYQSGRQAIYEYYFRKLLAMNRVYRCYCTRKEIQMAASAPNLGDEGPVYPGTCREKTQEEIDSTSHDQDAEYSWRFQVSRRQVRFEDAVLGEQHCQIDTSLGDFIVGRKSGEFAYQLAVTVDDHLMGVTEVVRGDDLVPSAYRQIELFETLGWAPPIFAHVPLVFGEDGRRLAKRHGSIRIEQFRKRDGTPDRLIGILGHSCGLIATPDPISTRDLLQHCKKNLVNVWKVLPKTAFMTNQNTWNQQYAKPVLRPKH